MPATPILTDPGQGDAVAFLADPASHGGAPVDIVTTHGAQIFLAGDRAYKLKRAVRYPYLDFSTLERRRAACAAEIAVNRRTAPDLYLRARPICRNQAGGLRFDGPGETVEWVVEMRRFDQSQLLDRMAEAGTLDEGLMAALAEAVAAFHRIADPAPRGWEDRMPWIVEDNLRELRALGAAAPAALDRLDEAAGAALAATAPLRAHRQAEGAVRRCHGDLHLRNVCLIDGRPVPFDAIEFSDDIAICDVLYDLAFLLMDLDHRGLRPFANRVLGRWLDRMEGDAGGGDQALALLPLFLSQRACVRAKVTATALAGAPGDDPAKDAPRREIAAYLDLAQAYLDPPPPRLVAIGGWSGTGKTTLARALAPRLGAAPGAILLRSDVERKRLAGVAETVRLPQDAYGSEMTAAVYDAMARRAAVLLAAGHSVIADAVHGTAAERAAIAAVAQGAGVPFDGLWLEAPLDTARRRVSARRGDASDADAAVVERQHRSETGPMAWPVLAAGGPLEALTRRALAALRLPPPAAWAAAEPVGSSG